jgi:CBS domain-containing protein
MLTNKVNEIMSRELVTATPSSTIFEVMELMVEKNVGRVIIAENQIPSGIFTEKDVLKRVMNKKLDPTNTAIKKVMTSPVRAVPQNTHIIDALGRMYRSKFRHLLIRDQKGNMIGMISMRRILKLAVELGQGLAESQIVGNIMSKDLLTLEADRPISEAVDLMTEKDKGCVAVMSHGKPRGIFTERDALKRVATKKLDPAKTPIEKVMTQDLVTLPHTSFIGQVLEEMYRGNFRHMPIVGDQKDLVGIVSMRDVLKYARAFDVDEKVRSTWKEIEEFWDSEEHYTPG